MAKASRSAAARIMHREGSRGLGANASPPCSWRLSPEPCQPVCDRVMNTQWASSGASQGASGRGDAVPFRSGEAFLAATGGGGALVPWRARERCSVIEILPSQGFGCRRYYRREEAPPPRSRPRLDPASGASRGLPERMRDVRDVRHDGCGALVPRRDLRGASGALLWHPW